jgi:hypothetical protein
MSHEMPNAYSAAAMTAKCSPLAELLLVSASSSQANRDQLATYKSNSAGSNQDAGWVR